jgi:hypothetical protein
LSPAVRARLAPALPLLAALAGCAAPGAARAPRAEAPRALWELAPEGASLGIVAHDGALAHAFDLFDTLRVRSTGDAPGASAPLSTREGAATLGLDPALGLAIFAWPQRERGVLVVLPVRDRAGLRRLTASHPARRGDREVDDLGNGYLCASAGGRYLCARSLADIDAAAAPHEAALARVVARLPAEDRGDVEVFASPRQSEIAHLRERARPLGLLTGVTAAVRLRPDGAGARIRLLGTLETAGARGLAGAPPPAELAPVAAGAATVLRAHFDAAALLPASSPLDARLRAELVEQLAGDVEAATSGDGVAGASLVALLRDPARVERYVKERCEGAGGSVRRYALDKITVTDHGCSARVDPALLLLPVAIRPIPVSLAVVERRLVLLVGDAREPSAEQRAWAPLVEGDEARRALTGPAALQVFTRRPIIGPDVDPAQAFQAMIPFLDERTRSILDTWGDIGAHVYQAWLTVRVAPEGVVFAGDFTTFAVDPPAARAAYEEALVQRARGDDAAYRAALATVEARFPGTRGARRAAEVRQRAPFVGAGLLFFAVLGGLLRSD